MADKPGLRLLLEFKRGAFTATEEARLNIVKALLKAETLTQTQDLFDKLKNTEKNLYTLRNEIDQIARLIG